MQFDDEDDEIFGGDIWKMKPIKDRYEKEEYFDDIPLNYGLKELYNKYINAIFISENKTVLKVIDSLDKVYYFVCSGDCCNPVWIEHITGVDCLINSFVNFIHPISWFEMEEEEIGDSIKNWNKMDFELTKKQFPIEYQKDLEFLDSIRNENYRKNMDCGFFSLKTNLGLVIIELRNNYDWAYGGGIYYQPEPNKKILDLIFTELKEDF